MLTPRTSQESLERLAGTWLFEECTRKELRRVAPLVTSISVKAGRVLAREGDYGAECVVVMKGQAVVERNGRIVGHAVEGSLVGEVALMDPRETRNATVTAVTEMDLLVLSRREFQNLRALGVASIEDRLMESAAAHGIRDAFDDLDRVEHRDSLHSLSAPAGQPEATVDA